MQEVWKSLKGVVENGDYYEVSNMGRVRSIDRVDKNNRKRKSRIISNQKQRDGYILVGLSKGGNQIHYLLHRLVALAFIPNPENKPEVNHKDGVKSNCELNNLEWATREENMQHAYDMGLIDKLDVGENHYLSKLKDEDVLRIRRMYSSKKYTQKQLSEMFGVGQDVISDIVRFVTWKHIGGEKHVSKPKRKSMSHDDVIKIREMYSTGEYKQTELAKAFNTSKKVINNIVNYKTFKDI